MEANKLGFCSLVSVNTEEKRATYEDMERSILIELNHDSTFIDYLSSHIDETQICFWIDLEKKEIVNREL